MKRTFTVKDMASSADAKNNGELLSNIKQTRLITEKRRKTYAILVLKDILSRSFLVSISVYLNKIGDKTNKAPVNEQINAYTMWYVIALRTLQSGESCPPLKASISHLELSTRLVVYINNPT
jgi:hypothetical protein